MWSSSTCTWTSLRQTHTGHSAGVQHWNRKCCGPLTLQNNKSVLLTLSGVMGGNRRHIKSTGTGGEETQWKDVLGDLNTSAHILLRVFWSTPLGAAGRTLHAAVWVTAAIFTAPRIRLVCCWTTQQHREPSCWSVTVSNTHTHTHSPSCNTVTSRIRPVSALCVFVQNQLLLNVFT